MTKSFMSFDDQLNYLTDEKNLIIEDREWAKMQLMEIGYFGLISGYKTPFKNTTTKKYLDNTSFSCIVELYNLDESLREIFLKYILKIERHIRSLLSYYFTEKYGEQQCHYLNSVNYNCTPKTQKDITQLVGMLDKLANYNSDYAYINHQRNVYKNVPLWVLINGITFGTLSKFYFLLTPDLKVKISKNFDNVNEKQLGQYLKVITKFRNVCAHNERLYCYQTKEDIPNTSMHKKLGIGKLKEQYICGKHDLFGLLISFRYLLPESDFIKVESNIADVLSNYFESPNALNQNKLYNLMGFPSNWNELSTFEK